MTRLLLVGIGLVAMAGLVSGQDQKADDRVKVEIHLATEASDDQADWWITAEQGESLRELVDYCGIAIRLDNRFGPTRNQASRCCEECEARQCSRSRDVEFRPARCRGPRLFVVVETQ